MASAMIDESSSSHTDIDSINTPGVSIMDESKLSAIPLDILDAPGDGRTVLVTGASGYIAGHIISLLLKKNWKVRGTVRDLRKTKQYAHLKLLESEINSQYPIELVEANLLKDDGWIEAIGGCDYVIHTASPFLLEEVDNADVMVKPAVQGTLSVLRACAKTSSVKRVVLTSSEVAITKSKYEKPNYVYTENDWSDWPSCPAYPQSKTLAEMEAWRFWRRLNNIEEPENKLNEGREWLADFQWSDDYKNKFELTVINPSYVQGKLLSANGCSSEVLIKRFLTGKIPAVPHCGTNIIAVEDVALAHVRALLCPVASGRRFLLSAGFAWFDDHYSKILAEEFDVNGYSIRQIKAPAPLLHLTALWDKQAKILTSTIGKITMENCSAARLLLGMNNLISAKKMIVEMAHSLIDLGIVPDNRHLHPIHQTVVRWDANNSTSACRQCAKSFNLVQRKHHCRLCGKIFCDDCCQGKIRGERACKSCIDSSGEAPRLSNLPIAQPFTSMSVSHPTTSAIPASSS